MAKFTVSTQAQLNSALKSARGGDTLELSGTFNKLDLRKAKYGDALTITSANKGNPATVKEMMLASVENVKIDGLKFDYGGSGSMPFVVERSSKVTISNAEFDGHISGGYGKGIGLRVRQSSDIKVENSEASDFNNGFSFSNVQNLTVSNNDMRGMANDAMTFAGITKALITGNDFRAMKAKGQKHKDMIQFWTSNNEGPSKEITIRGNTIDNKEKSHAIFIGNELVRAGDRSKGHRDFLIEKNDIKSAHTHGISFEYGNGLIIRDNVVQQHKDAGGKGWVPLINVGKGSENVAIINNTVASVPDEAGPSWTVSGNKTGSKNMMHWDGNTKQSGKASEPSSTFKAWMKDGGSGSKASGTAVKSATQDRSDAEPQPVQAEKAPEATTADAGFEGVAPTKPMAHKMAYVQGDEFRFDGRKIDGDQVNLIENPDFDGGDMLILIGYEQGTFGQKRGGNPLVANDEGNYVRIDSALDLQELTNMSRKVSAAVTEDDTLVLSIQQSDGVHKIALTDMGRDFAEAYQPELF